MATKKAKTFAWLAIVALLVTTLSSIFLGARSSNSSRQLNDTDAEAIVTCLDINAWDAQYVTSASGYSFHTTATLTDAEQSQFNADVKSCVAARSASR